EMNTSTGQVYATDLRTHQAREISPDSETTLGKAAADLRYRFNWETPIAFEGDANQKLLLGGNVVFGTRDGGANWSVMSPDLTRNDRSKQGPSGGPITHDMTGAETYDTILDIAPSPIQSLDVWVSTDDGLVQLTRDGGLTWSNITPANVPEWSRIDCVEPSYHLEGRAYIALDRHMNGDTRPYIYQTDDYGAHWRKISSGIPNDLFVRVIREDPINSVLFAGTQRGVWFSTDDGKHWSSLRLNMPASAVYDIAIQRRRHDLIVATYGRGLWILDDMRPVEELPSSTLPVIYIPQPAYRMWRWSPIQSFPGGIQSNVFAGESAPYGAILTFLAPKAAHARVEILKSDRVVRHIDLGVVNPGLHRVVWDLNEDGPTQWLGTYPDNRGPTEGAESLPGVYTVRLFLGSDKLDGTFSVRPDPRDIGAIGRYAERYSTLNTLYRDLDVVDKILNRIGPAEGKRRGLTSDPQFYEGVTVAPPGLREEIQDLLGRLSSAYQAPTAAQLQQLNSIDERVKALR
ncbi:MAG: hypothetical protein JO322_05030, partial [Candidatus Eremiobacteraeota bacterium]|nr:hypothetical protein [Candidatus Eremiobacteraeota bacterium]